MATTDRTALQRLYELCKETFSPQGGVPPLSAVDRFTARLDTIRSEDVGLDEATIMEIERRSFSSRSNKRKRGSETTSIGSRSMPKRTPNPPVTYIHLHECATFSIGIFCLPASAIIPLHDHSEMTVFTKLLYGSMNVKAYDWLDPSPIITSHPLDWKLAALKTDDDFEAPLKPWVLYPTTGGNIHSFRAITSCAVLDVLSPPYSGDNPKYYREYPSSSFPARHGETAEGRVWLEKLERPENFIIRVQPYRGPILEVT